MSSKPQSIIKNESENVKPKFENSVHPNLDLSLCLVFPAVLFSSKKAEEESNSSLLSVARPKIYSENSFIVDEQLAEDECLCEVCCDLIDSTTSSVLYDMEDTMTCKHKICLRCWKLHLTAKLQQDTISMVIEQKLFWQYLNFCM